MKLLLIHLKLLLKHSFIIASTYSSVISCILASDSVNYLHEGISSVEAIYMYCILFHWYIVFVYKLCLCWSFWLQITSLFYPTFLFTVLCPACVQCLFRAHSRRLSALLALWRHCKLRTGTICCRLLPRFLLSYKLI